MKGTGRPVTRGLSLLAIAALAASASGRTVQADYAVTSSSGIAGSARMQVKLLDDGSKEVTVAMDLSYQDQKHHVVQTTRHDARGRPTRVLLETFRPGRKNRVMKIATITGGSARVVHEERGARRTQVVTLDERAPVENAAEWWFWRDRPREGERVVAYRFDINELRWNQIETVYRGRTTIMVGGVPRDAHHVRSGSADAFLDDDGLPWVVEQAGLRLVRVVPETEEIRSHGRENPRQRGQDPTLLGRSMRAHGHGGRAGGAEVGLGPDHPRGRPDARGREPARRAGAGGPEPDDHR